MAVPRPLANAPITEAILDIRVKLPADLELGKLKTVQTVISENYPTIRERRRWESRVRFSVGAPPKQVALDKGPDGYLFTSTGGKQIVQFRLDGFTFNRLKPYETWESMRDEAYRLWRHYVDVASPELITRVALRYINHLKIPLPIGNFADYLVAPPTVPGQLPHFLTSFLTRVVILDSRIGAAANISQALESTSEGTLILDIDVYKQAAFSVEGKEAWEFLEELRHFKNRIFFESVTEHTLRLCE